MPECVVQCRYGSDSRAKVDSGAFCTSVDGQPLLNSGQAGPRSLVPSLEACGSHGHQFLSTLKEKHRIWSNLMTEENGRDCASNRNYYSNCSQPALFPPHKYDTFPLWQEYNRCNLLTYGIISASTERWRRIWVTDPLIYYLYINLRSWSLYDSLETALEISAMRLARAWILPPPKTSKRLSFACKFTKIQVRISTASKESIP